MTSSGKISAERDGYTDWTSHVDCHLPQSGQRKVFIFRELIIYRVGHVDKVCTQKAVHCRRKCQVELNKYW